MTPTPRALTAERTQNGWVMGRRDQIEADPGDIADVMQVTTRDDSSIDYEVRVTLRSLDAAAYEEGEGQVAIWRRRIYFGATDARCSGGSDFVLAAREQERCAEWAWLLMMGQVRP